MLFDFSLFVWGTYYDLQMLTPDLALAMNLAAQHGRSDALETIKKNLGSDFDAAHCSRSRSRSPKITRPPSRSRSPTIFRSKWDGIPEPWTDEDMDVHCENFNQTDGWHARNCPACKKCNIERANYALATKQRKMQLDERLKRRTRAWARALGVDEHNISTDEDDGEPVALNDDVEYWKANDKLNKAMEREFPAQPCPFTDEEEVEEMTAREYTSYVKAKANKTSFTDQDQQAHDIQGELPPLEPPQKLTNDDMKVLYGKHFYP